MVRRKTLLGAVGAVLLISSCSREDSPKPPPPPAPTLNTTAAKALGEKSPLQPSHPEAKYPTPTKTIHLTFDDGPGKYTIPILEILEREHVPATFFIIGRQAPNYPEVMKRERELGMSMQVHTWDHINTFPTLSAKGLDRQVNRTAAVIKEYSGVQPSCVRPPEGATTGRVRRWMNGQGYGQILWDNDTEDWRRPGSKAIINTAISEARDGGIILMHDGGGNRSQDVQALPEIIHGLRERGYSFAPLCNTPGKVNNLPR